MKYILQNKNTRMFLKYYRDINFKHYILDKDEATRFTFKVAKQIKNKYKYPDNWIIKRVKEAK